LPTATPTPGKGSHLKVFLNGKQSTLPMHGTAELGKGLRQSRTVCICNAHSVVTATQDPRFLEVLRQADMATPDGAPVAWMMRRLSHPGQHSASTAPT
jgi:UDP-N-acetyl-D-mannosaminuronic acid transferase (WecB/TagA/CpsF family)